MSEAQEMEYCPRSLFAEEGEYIYCTLCGWSSKNLLRDFTVLSCMKLRNSRPNENYYRDTLFPCTERGDLIRTEDLHGCSSCNMQVYECNSLLVSEDECVVLKRGVTDAAVCALCENRVEAEEEEI